MWVRPHFPTAIRSLPVKNRAFLPYNPISSDTFPKVALRCIFVSCWHLQWPLEGFGLFDPKPLSGSSPPHGLRHNQDLRAVPLPRGGTARWRGRQASQTLKLWWSLTSPAFSFCVFLFLLKGPRRFLDPSQIFCPVHSYPGAPWRPSTIVAHISDSGAGIFCPLLLRSLSVPILCGVSTALVQPPPREELGTSSRLSVPSPSTESGSCHSLTRASRLT